MISQKEWEHDYISAILETDNERLAGRIATVKSKIFARVKQLNIKNCGTLDERSSIVAALTGLNKLETERLGLVVP